MSLDLVVLGRVEMPQNVRAERLAQLLMQIRCHRVTPISSSAARSAFNP